MITEWRTQFESSRYAVDPWTTCLLLVGDSQQGKSSKAVSLFGLENTLKVSCQGLPPGVLPGLGRLDRDKHKAIVWDEIRPDQVLNNREVFQSNAFEQFLQQSICNQHAFSVWLYHIAQILCANWFDTESTALSSEDVQGSKANFCIVELGPGQNWYLSP